MTDHGRHEAAITSIVLAAPHADADARERWRPRLDRLVEDRGGVVVTTCQRTEAWVGAAVPIDERPLEAVLLEGDRAARHAIALAVGLESAVLAEDQVLHQLRRAVGRARRRTLPRDHEIVATSALRAGRVARSWRPAGARSLADVAVDRVLAATPGAGRLVLVVGAGMMGRLAARALATRRVPVAVASRDPGRARSVADPVSGETWPWDPGARLRSARAVIVALGGPWRLEGRSIEHLAAVGAVADLSQPRAVPAAAAAALGARFLDVDAIAETAAIDPPTRAEMTYRARLDALVEQSLEEIRERLASRESAELASTIARRAEREREEELAALWRRLPDLGQDDRDAIEGMTRHLARRLLREPLERLGRDADGRGRRAAEELFGL